MAKEKASGKGKASPPPQILDKLGDDWGDDWESAFQSEDLDHDDEELSEEFRFDDDGRDDGADGEDGEDAALDPSDEEGQGAGGKKTGPGALGILLTAFTRLGRGQWRRFQALSRPQKMMTGGVTLALALILLLFYSLSRPPAPHQIVLPDDPFGLRETTATPGTIGTIDAIDAMDAVEPMAAAPADPAPPPITPPTRAAAPEPLPPPPPQPERHRLSLPGFLIPVAGDTEHGDLFLHLDLTLTIQVPSGEEPDPRLKAKLRESIYNFYHRRDPATLRRYSLARGDMLRDLRLWLEDDLPELAADAIAFDRYWID